MARNSAPSGSGTSTQPELLLPISHPVPWIPIDPSLLAVSTAMPPPGGPTGFLESWPNHRQWEICFVDNESQIPPRQHQALPLDNDIHPLWRYKNWRQYWLVDDETDFKVLLPSECDQPSWLLPPAVYDRMLPALRLATMILQRSLPFMAMIIRCPVPDLGSGIDVKDYVFDQHWCPNHVDFAILEKELERLASNYRIFSRPPAPLTGNVELGTSEVVLRSDHAMTADSIYHDDQFALIVTIAQEYIRQFSDQEFANKTNEHIARICASLALTLTHEVCHSLFTRRVQRNEQIKRRLIKWYTTIEPRVFPSITQNEIGHMSTRWLFGCEFLYASHEQTYVIDHAQGLLDSFWTLCWDGSLPLLAGHLVTDNNPALERSFTLTKRTTEDIFDRSTWQGDKLTIYLIR